MQFRVPHPIPYQGSKRRLSKVVLDHFPSNVDRLIEPFAGSAAITIAAAAQGVAARYIIGDSLVPLADLWRQIINGPVELADTYEQIWQGQTKDARGYYLDVRADFNREQRPAQLLYLLARCVKNAVRFSSSGEFNQSADHRRKGMNPRKMRGEILGASALLRGKTSVFGDDYQVLLDDAKAADLVYMDPPYQGVSDHRDRRYFQQLDLDRLIQNLDGLNSRGIPFLLSFDGTCGGQRYGEPLPADLRLSRVLIHTGKSSQATLNGDKAETVESLYVSPAISKRGRRYYSLSSAYSRSKQLSLLVKN